MVHDGAPHTPPHRSDNEGVVVADAGALAPDGARAPRGSDGAAPNDGHASALAFEAWWQEYPRKEGRAAAKRAFDAVMARGVPVTTLVSKARQYALAKAHVADSKYIKQPANWLKEECWLEDPQPPRPKAPKPERASKPERATSCTRVLYDPHDKVFSIGACVRPTAAAQHRERMLGCPEIIGKGEVVGLTDDGYINVRWFSGRTDDDYPDWSPADLEVVPRPVGFKVGARVREGEGFVHRDHAGEIGEVISAGKHGAIVQWPSGKVSYGEGAVVGLEVVP
jgi:hypothetical protein